ncbi:MAG TPA: Gfo/Idh/MocA family oxidoreductase [Nitrosopumilaceae archaeon]|nr:Gfo/Idh/MocA family oxidoreductase [Nitrosopumilaceae archaeon]
MVSKNKVIMKRYKVVIIGLGRVGMGYGLDPKRTQPASHIAAIIKNKNLQLSAICDSDKNRRSVFVKNYGNIAHIYDNYYKMIQDLNKKIIDYDIIVIATPDSTHSKILTYIIKNLKIPKKQIIIFCEKPLALNSKIAKKLRFLPRNSNLNVVVNHSRRWSKVWQEAKRLTANIGYIQKASFYFSTSPENKEISQIRDGIHIADLIAWLKITEKTTVTRLKLPYFIYDFHLWGTRGKIEVLNWGEVLNFFRVEKSSHFQGFKELKLVFSKKERESLMANTYEEFVKFLDGRKKSLSTNFNDAIDAVEIFEKCVFDKKLSINNTQT